MMFYRAFPLIVESLLRNFVISPYYLMSCLLLATSGMDKPKAISSLVLLICLHLDPSILMGVETFEVLDLAFDDILLFILEI